MITENMLRAALRQEAEDAAPVRAETLTATRGHAEPLNSRPVLVRERAVGAPNRRRRAFIGAGAVGAVAAGVVVAVAVSVSTTQSGPTRTQPAAASGRSAGFAPVSWYAVTAPTGLVVQTRTLTADRQSVVFGEQTTTATQISTQEAARVDLYAAGAFDPTAVTTGTAVQVGSRTGYRATIAVQQHDGVPGSTQPTPVVAWQWSDGAWAVAAGLNATQQTQPAEQALAAAIEPGTNPVRLPAQFDALPAGLVRTSVIIDEALPGLQRYVATFQRAADLPADPSTSDADYVLSMTISDANRTAGSGDKEQPTSDPTTPVLQSAVVAGGITYTLRTVHLQGFTTAYLNGPDSPLTIQIDVRDRVSSSFDPRWAQFNPAPSWTDHATWADATSALP